MKLIKKSSRGIGKVSVWVEEKDSDNTLIKRKLFTIYDTTLKEIEEMLLENFKEK